MGNHAENKPQSKKKLLGLILAAAVVLCAVAAVLLLRPGAGGSQSNLLLNGDFSQLDEDNRPLYWYADAYDGLGNAIFEAVREGEGNVAHIENLIPKDSRFAQRVTVEPGSLYLLHGYIRASAQGGRGANLSVEGVALYSEQVYDAPDWQEVSLYGMTGDDQTAVTVFARLGGYSGEASGNAYFRDVTLTKVDSVPLGAYAYQWYVPSASGGTTETVDVDSSNASLLLAACSLAYLALFTGLCHFLRKPKIELEAQAPAWKTILPLGILLLIAFAARLIIAACVRGYDVDIGCFTGWANGLAATGPANFYQYIASEARWNCDYPPGYLWILWAIGGLGRLMGTGATEMMVKIPPILSDLALCVILLKECRKRLSLPASLAGALLYALNPLVLLTGSAWGQADALMTLLLVLVVLFALRDRWRAALPLYLTAVLFKPQALMFGPLGLAAFILYILKNRKNEAGRQAMLREIGLGFGFMVLTGVLIVLPFSVRQSPDFLLQLYTKTMGQYFYATVNNCNVYFLLGKNWADAGLSLANAPWIPALTFGLVMAPLLLASVLRATKKWPDRMDRSQQNNLSLCLGLTAALVLVLAVLNALNRLSFHFLGAALVIGAAAWMAYLQYRTVDNKRLVLSGLSLLMGLTLVILGARGVLTFASLGTVMIVYGVALMILLFLLSGDGKSLPLYGAGMLILLCNTGAMMHERYVFPAVALLLLAYAINKDSRILWLTVGVSIAGFLNVGCVLDRNIRIGGFAGSLDSPLHYIASDLFILEYLSAGLNCVLCMATVLLCAQWIDGETMPLRPQTRKHSPLPVDHGLPRMTRRDGVILLVVTVLYAGLAFANLGSTKAPQTAFSVPVAPRRVVMDLREETDFQVSYYVNYHRADSQVSIEVSSDGEVWTLASVEPSPADEYYFWKTPMSGEEDDVPLTLHGRYARLISDQDTFGQLSVYFTSPETGEELPATRILDSVYDDQAVLDLGETKTFHMLYFGGIHQLDSDFTVEISADGEIWDHFYTASMKIGECFQWKYLTYYAGGYPIELTGRYIRLTASRMGQTLYEVLFRDAADETVLPVTLVSDTLENQTAACLIDEQDTLEGEPGWYNSMYFDEIYHARTGFEHLHNLQPYECTHPPLGKVFMSWCIALFGMTPFGWRFAGALAGVLMLPGMYLLGKLLIRKKWGGWAAALLLALDLMHFTQTRIATIDSFVVLFIIWMFYFMLRWFYQDFFRMKFWKTLIPLALSGLCMGLGVASKWTGCYAGVALACLFFLGIWRRFRLVKRARKIHWRRVKAGRNQKQKTYRLSPASRPMPDRRGAPWQLRAAKRGTASLLITVASCLIFFVAVPALIYYLSYVPYFAYNGGVTVQKIIDSANYMLWYHSQPGWGMDHPYYTPWYEWPIMYRPMFYFSSIYEPAGYQSSIMAFGNPAVWWGGLMGLICVCFLAIRRHMLTDRSLSPYVEKDDSRFAVLLICFFVQYLPWTLVPRGTYIYHYFPCVPIIILCGLMCLDHWGEKKPKAANIALIVWMVLSALLFIGFFPYASGMLTPEWWMKAMQWFPRIYY